MSRECEGGEPYSLHGHPQEHHIRANYGNAPYSHQPSKDQFRPHMGQDPYYGQHYHPSLGEQITRSIREVDISAEQMFHRPHPSYPVQEVEQMPQQHHEPILQKEEFQQRALSCTVDDLIYCNDNETVITVPVSITTTLSELMQRKEFRISDLLNKHQAKHITSMIASKASQIGNGNGVQTPTPYIKCVYASEVRNEFPVFVFLQLDKLGDKETGKNLPRSALIEGEKDIEHAHLSLSPKGKIPKDKAICIFEGGSLKSTWKSAYPHLTPKKIEAPFIRIDDKFTGMRNYQTTPALNEAYELFLSFVGPVADKLLIPPKNVNTPQALPYDLVRRFLDWALDSSTYDYVEFKTDNKVCLGLQNGEKDGMPFDLRGSDVYSDLSSSAFSISLNLTFVLEYL